MIFIYNWKAIALFRMKLNNYSFPCLVGGARLLDALAYSSSIRIFAIATGNMWQLVGISFTMHRVWEVLSMGRLGHWGATIVVHSSCRSLDAWVRRPHTSHSCDSCGGRPSYWSLRGAAVVDSLALARGVIAVLHWGWRIHTHKIA